jgi:hypothetical protein
MSIQEQERVEAAAANPPREGLVHELFVSAGFASVRIKKVDGDLDLIGLWNDQDPLDKFDRLERSMFLSICREAMIHGKRVRINLRQAGPHMAHSMALLA